MALYRKEEEEGEEVEDREGVRSQWKKGRGEEGTIKGERREEATMSPTDEE